MKKRTDEEIIEFFLEMTGSYNDGEVKISRDEGRLVVNVAQSYDFVAVDFKVLKSVGEFFETDKVNGSEGEYWNGCGTCDYGSSYSVDFVIEE